MFVLLKNARCALTAAIGLVFLLGCHRSATEACSDGPTCLREARALAESYAQAPHTRERTAQLLALFQRGCDLGSASACAMLAGYFHYGQLVPGDLPHAARLYERGCELQEVRACDQLSNLYRDGHGVPKDSALARKYRQLACRLADSMTRDTFCEWDRHDPIDGAAPK
jgi:TPR repeat protein